MTPVTYPSHSSIHSTLLQSKSKSKSNQNHNNRDPTTVPLPPSPPPTETLNLDDHLTKPNQNQTNNQTSSILIKSNQHDALNQSTRNQITRNSNKRSRSDHNESIQTASPPISSPIQTHTNHQSIHLKKRTKLEKSKSKSIQSSSPHESKSSSSSRFKDSPNNPFLVKKGDSIRQAGQFHDEQSRKLVYVFRGKRIQYDPGEDLHNTGDSPFKLSTPKLLFPSNPIQSLSPPSNQFTFERNDSFITPKKDQNNHHDLIGLGLPTPQLTRQKKTNPIDLLNGISTGIDGNPSSSSSNNHNHSKQSISKGMR